MAKTENDAIDLDDDNEENDTAAADNESNQDETVPEMDAKETKAKPGARKRGRAASATGNGVKTASNRAAKNKVTYKETDSEDEESTNGGKAKKPINGKARKNDDDGAAKSKKGRGRPPKGETKAKAKTGGSGKPRGRPKKV